MAQVLLLLSLVIIVCILCNKLTSRVGVPMLLAFLAVGMLCGTDGLLGITFDNYNLTENICTVTLIFIFLWRIWDKMEYSKIGCRTSNDSFYGWRFFTAAVVGVFCHFALSMEWLESLLIGAVLSLTDAVSVFSILRSKKLNLKYGTASLLEVESGSNDPVAYLMTTVLLHMMHTEVTTGQIVYMIFSQIVYGAVIGAVLATAIAFFCGGFILKRPDLTWCLCWQRQFSLMCSQR
ncbi:MAG: cation:proton antiporter [Ruminococcus sp.]|nr:cation:proton antiporter [Ruminococcus sp.]